MTLSELPAGRAAVAGDEPALTWSRRAVTLTWAELDRRGTAVGTPVSADDPDLGRLRAAFPPGALRACYVATEAIALVACGRPAGRRVAIVARGSWKRPEESARVFCALTGDDEPRWWPRGEVERVVRQAVSARHGLTPRRVVVLQSAAGDGLW